MFLSHDTYLPKSADYQQGFDDGYKVAVQEIKDFVSIMGSLTNPYTGTATTRLLS